ncbi:MULTISPECIES: Hsp20/alpha crystallin family protein [Tenacibaculum]|uniref:Heat-shock protein n=1 Tax=Tenacibaculum discolor TaxID=361581 RepID=A0A2G1BXC6_9FLAO|nr:MULTISPECIES: Hsp20/alpha crystallin family protein [Tenacibaculum]MDP2540577.1 Hsp20/alpha crystallin family protein [Tenacibaculum discolor]NVK08833.1 Hsp20/alpha crystallin family protein [Tenacibaculum sp.]PHN98539.1 heat-shock protein [Tenacibaculum discolor]RLK02404.1 heat shock protein Hsp20 [Tenacibaculum discolor]
MLLKSTDFPALPNVFNDFFRDWSTSNFSDTNTTLPAVNIKENENEFTVDVAAPGMNKEDFQVNLENDILTISSERKENKEDTNDNYTRKEYSYMSFRRSFTLPKGIVDSEKIKATYKNGELKINIPKLETAKPKPAKLITVE